MIVQGYLGNLKWDQGKHKEAQELVTKVLESRRRTLGDNHPWTIAATNTLSWWLATAPESSGLRDGAKAVELGKKAVAAFPLEGNYWNTLGVAQYRAGEWNDAIKSLEKSMELHKGGDSNDWFFLAMAHWQLGHPDQAGQWYKKAVDAMEKAKSRDPELLRFRAEAEAMIKTDTVLPDDVFRMAPPTIVIGPSVFRWGCPCKRETTRRKKPGQQDAAERRTGTTGATQFSG